VATDAKNMILRIKPNNTQNAAYGPNKFFFLIHTHATQHLEPVTVVVHGGGDLAETGNVGTGDKGRQLALLAGDVLLCGVEAVEEAVLHDALELLVDLLARPR